MFDEIFLPTDGTKRMTSVIETALDVAARYDARLHVLYVVDGTVPEYLQETDREGLFAFGEAATREVAELAAYRGVDVVTAVQEGVPQAVVLEYAATHDVDLIVVGVDRPTTARGRVIDALSRDLLGDLPAHVVRRSPVPVVTVRV
ncbi:MAG: universal stress protein [Haloarculaceae archaeon]